MRLVVTRPRPESEEIASALRARGHEVLIEPMLEIVPTGAPVALDGVQAILATSANGVRALAAATDTRTLPLYAVGDATAKAAKAAGFAAVETAAGDAASLAELVAARATPPAGTLLHARGHDVAGDLAGALAARGFEIREAELYRAAPAIALSPALRRRIADGEIDAILFFSPRTARTFATLARAAGIGDSCAGISAVCLSPAVAEAASALRWRETRIAASPDRDALLGKVNGVAGDAGGREDVTDSNDRKASPSTLEKAAARDAEERRASAATAAGASKASPPAGPAGKSRHATRWVVGTLAVALLLAVAWIAWPAWGPALPGGVRAALAPVMDAGRGGGVGEQIGALGGRVAALEKDLAALRADLANRPAIDPAKLAAVEGAAEAATAQTRALAGEVAALQKALQQAPPGGDAAALEKRLAALESRLTALAAEPGSAEAVAALEALRAQSAARIAQLERGTLALQQTIATLDRRLAAVESRPAGTGTTRENARVLAVGQLREAARGAGPFAPALAAVAALAGDDAALRQPVAQLAPHAEKGVPDLAALRLEFDRIAGRIAHEAFVPEGEGWVDRTLQSLARLVTIRRADRAAATRDDENGRVARAELRLAAGDLAGAVAALDGLTGRAAEIAAPWLGKARARLAVERAIDALYAEALRRTGSAAGSAPPGSSSGTDPGSLSGAGGG